MKNIEKEHGEVLKKQKEMLDLIECIEYAEKDPELAELGEDVKKKVIDGMYESLRKEVKSRTTESDEHYKRENLEAHGFEY